MSLTEAGKFAHQIVNGGPLVPSLGKVRRLLDQLVETFQRNGVLLLDQRYDPCLHQAVDRVVVGLRPDLPDLLLDDLRLGVARRRPQTLEQRIEARILLIRARHFGWSADDAQPCGRHQGKQPAGHLSLSFQLPSRAPLCAKARATPIPGPDHEAAPIDGRPGSSGRLEAGGRRPGAGQALRARHTTLKPARSRLPAPQLGELNRRP